MPVENFQLPWRLFYLIGAFAGLVTCYSPDSLAQKKEAVSPALQNSSGPDDQVSRDLQFLLGDKTQCPVSSGADQGKFQTSQACYLAGYSLDGGMMDLTADQFLPKVCGDAGKAGVTVCDQKEKDGAKAYDMAARVYGIPSAAVICIRIQSTKTLKESNPDSTGEAKIPPLSKDAEKANKELLKKAEDQYRKLIGKGPAPGDKKGENLPDLSPVQGQALSDFDKYRRLLIELTSTLVKSKAMQRGNDDYINLIRLLAVSTYHSPEEAKKMAQKPLSQLDLKGNDKTFADGVIKCMSDAGALVGASEIPKGMDPGPE